jgi:hypothetical protein
MVDWEALPFWSFIIRILPGFNAAGGRKKYREEFVVLIK